jgi:hypothetical protein
MFAKVFSQILDSSIAEDYRVRHIFMDLLVMADTDGVVDKTPQAIARIANVPLDQIQMALAALSLPDTFSRTKDHDGRRIQLIDSQRDWGWRIVNYQKYRDIRDEEARRIANRSYKRAQRQRASQQKSAECPDSQQSQQKSAQGEVEVDVEVEGEVEKSKAAPGLHPLQYAHKMIQMLAMPSTQANMRAIEAALTAEVQFTGMSLEEAAQAIARHATIARTNGASIDKFYFEDTKWRNGNGSKRKPSPVEERVSGNRVVLSQALRDHVAQRVGPDSDKLQNGNGAAAKRGVP